MIARGQGLGRMNLKALIAIEKIMTEWSPAEAHLVVRACKLSRCYDRSKTRLSIALIEQPLAYRKVSKLLELRAVQGSEMLGEDRQLLEELEAYQYCSLREIIRSTMQQIEAKHLTGRMPQGAMESLLQSSLETKKQRK